MNDRKVHYIDGSKMTEQELCQALGIKYVPWYKDSLFWSIVFTFSLPYVIMLIQEVLK